MSTAVCASFLSNGPTGLQLVKLHKGTASISTVYCNKMHCSYTTFLNYHGLGPLGFSDSELTLKQ
jgi:hypothetical protein